VNSKSPLLLTTASLALAVVLSSCSGAALEKKATQVNALDNHLSIRGRVCTDPPDPSGFPVKVVMLVDQSGSMCISDPPGSQGTAGLCEQFATAVGIQTPARVRALQALTQQFATQPNVQVTIVPWDTNVKNVWPPVATGQRFARPIGIDSYIANLQAQLGKGTDFQGALSYAYGVIASDIADTNTNNPQLLPRTRYVVVLLTDGTPYPRCSANDNLSQYADPTHPELIWADSLPDFCNLTSAQGTDAINGFVPGTDRNQNYQIFSYVDQIMQLKPAYNVGDIRLHTVLLFSDQGIATCNSLGLLCQDIYGVYPNTAPADYPMAAHEVATWLLQQMAARGNGVFQEFRNNDIQNLGLGALDYTSLASKNVVKSLIVRSLRSVPDGNGRAVDSDGDGLKDDLDQPFVDKSNQFIGDTDGDCFDDNFEVIHRDLGFTPDKKDIRGCDPASPLTLNCICRDTDGDGLSQFAEAYLKTRAALVDSDGDGLPDGLEAQYGLDPLTRNYNVDTDNDGIADDEEIRAGTDPTRPDRNLYDLAAVQYTSSAEVQPDGSVCYDYVVSNLELVTPPNGVGAAQAGYNLFKVWFAEAPESAVSSDYGVWKTACAWAQYDPSGIRVPAGPDIQVDDAAFMPPNLLISDPDYLTRCVGLPPGSVP
jgi:hypothetical protein